MIIKWGELEHDQIEGYLIDNGSVVFLWFGGASEGSPTRDAHNRNFPLIHPERTFPLPATDRVFPVTRVNPAFNFVPGYSKRALLGERVYPFAELFVDPISDISSIGWKKKSAGSFTAVTVGAYPDLYTATKFIEFLPQVFDNNLIFNLKIIDTAANIIEKDVSVISSVEIAAHKAVLADQQFKPFSDATFAEDTTLITAIKYEISGASTVAKTAIPVEQFLAGTHDGASGSASLIDSTKNFLMLGIRINDIVKNTTDGSQALVTAFAKTTNDNDTLTLDGLSGGTDNDFDTSDSYTITDGDNLINRAKKFELTLTGRILGLLGESERLAHRQLKQQLQYQAAQHSKQLLHLYDHRSTY